MQYPQHHYHPQQQQQQQVAPPLHFGGHHAPPPVTPTPPPADPEQRAVIDRLVAYLDKNGPHFERFVREKESANPRFRFLFDIGSPTNQYYVWRQHCQRMRWSEEQIDGEVHRWLQQLHQPQHLPPQHFAPQQPQHLPPQHYPMQQQQQQQQQQPPHHLLPDPRHGPPPAAPPAAAAAVQQDPFAMHDRGPYDPYGRDARHASQSSSSAGGPAPWMAEAERVAAEAADAEGLPQALARDFDALFDARSTTHKEDVKQCRRLVVKAASQDPAVAASVVRRLFERMRAVHQGMSDGSLDEAQAYVRKLHIVYVISDAVHAIMRKSPEANAVAARAWTPLLPFILAYACCEQSTEQRAKVERIAQIWRQKALFDQAACDAIMQAVALARVRGAPPDPTSSAAPASASAAQLIADRIKAVAAALKEKGLTGGGGGVGAAGGSAGAAGPPPSDVLHLGAGYIATLQHAQQDAYRREHAGQLIRAYTPLAAKAVPGQTPESVKLEQDRRIADGCVPMPVAVGVLEVGGSGPTVVPD